jgi:bifunctional DNase/RNase
MRRIYPLSIQGSAAQSGSYILMLVDPDNNMQIPLLVGAQEAKSILAVQDGVSPSQPLTHHLFKLC